MAKSGLLNDFNMPKTRRLILLAIKEHAELTADDLADMLGISAVAVRRHLDTLKNAQLIEYEEVQNGVGRPSFVYSLTTKAEHIFPRNYEELAQDMLDTIRDMYGPEGVDAIFKARAKKIAQIYKPYVNANGLPQRIEQLVELRQADGYMASWEELDDGKFVVTELNCPIHQVAKTCDRICSEDLRMYADLLEADVIMLNHQVQGDKCCTYQINPKV